MHPNEALVRGFYGAFARRDAASMIACYAPDVSFRDPAFGELNAADAAAMWEMLCFRGKDLHVELGEVHADHDDGRAHWEAFYTFSATGRKVHNRIDARFEFVDGRIYRHEDRFDMAAWTRQALGLPGVLLGWLPPFQATVRKRALGELERFKHRSR